MFRRWFTLARDVAVATWRRAAEQDLMLLSAGLTLYAGIAVVPLLLFGLYGAGLLLGPQRVADLVAQLSTFAPEGLGASEVLRTLGAVGPRLGVPALIASVLTALTYGDGLLRAIDSLEGDQRAATSLRGRLLALPYLGVFPLVTLAGLATVAVLPDLLGTGRTSQVLGVYVTFWVGWLSAAALLTVLYRLFAGRRLRWAAIVWGALAAGSFLAGMSLGWVLILKFDITIGQAYGGSEQLGAVVLAAIYLLFVQYAVLIGYLVVLSIEHHLLLNPHPTKPQPPRSSATTSTQSKHLSH